MRSTLRERWSEWKYSTERTLAPHVEEAWAESLVLELRLQGVGGPAIGEALSEVESHCAESGETALDAFGDPAGYARSLQLPVAPAQASQRIAAAAAPTVVQLVGMLVTLWAFAAWVDGDALVVTSGQVLAVILCVGTVVALVCFVDQALRLSLTRPVVTFLTVMAISGLAAALPALARHELGAVSALPVVAASGTVLLAGVAWERVRSTREDDDIITSPIDPPLSAEEAAASARLTNALSTLTCLSLPMITVIGLVFLWIAR